MTHWLGALAGLLGSVVVPAAWAGPPRDDAAATVDADELDSAEDGSVWYGWQTLVLDGATHSVAALALFAEATQEIGALIGVVGGLEYLLGGPVVHWAHGHGGRGAASLGLRLATPIVAVVAAATLFREVDYRFIPLALLSVLMAPVVVDAAALSYDSPGVRRRATVPVVPTARIDAERWVVGVAGVL